jgi:hypothetical protein
VDPSVRVRLSHVARYLGCAELLSPVFGCRFAEAAVNAIRGAVLHVARRKMRLCAGHASARDVVLVVELRAVGAACVFLVLLVAVCVVLVILVVLERLAQVHLHPVALVARPPVHHSIVTLVPMALVVEHGKLLG